MRVLQEVYIYIYIYFQRRSYVPPYICYASIWHAMPPSRSSLLRRKYTSRAFLITERHLALLPERFPPPSRAEPSL